MERRICLLFLSLNLSACSFDIPDIGFSASHLRESNNEFDKALYATYSLDKNYLGEKDAAFKAEAMLEQKFSSYNNTEEMKEYLIQIGADCSKTNIHSCYYEQHINHYTRNFFLSYEFDEKVDIAFRVSFACDVDDYRGLSVATHNIRSELDRQWNSLKTDTDGENNGRSICN